jgi:catechol 2,3-dioxygenase-like lactoylglutathione lyase family enzyme
LHVKSLDHIHIYAAEPERSAMFYKDHFEARELVRNNNVNGDLRVFLSLGDQVLVVGSFPAGLSPATPPAVGDGAFTHGFGIAHFGLRVDDAEAAASDLARAGVHVIGEVVREESGLTYVYVEAPDGVVIELTQYE